MKIGLRIRSVETQKVFNLSIQDCVVSKQDENHGGCTYCNFEESKKLPLRVQINSLEVHVKFSGKSFEKSVTQRYYYLKLEYDLPYYMKEILHGKFFLKGFVLIEAVLIISCTPCTKFW